MIRLIASDLDGTLLEPVERLPEGLFDTIRRLHGQGIRFAAASGRQYDNLRRLFAPVAHEMCFICENGALNMVGEEEASAVPIPYKMGVEIVRDLMQMPVCILVSGRHTCYVTPENRAFTDDMVYRLRNTSAVDVRMDQLDDIYLKISAFSPDGVASFAPILEKKWGNHLHAVVSGQCWFDFGIASKETGIDALRRRFDLSRDEIVAFGDNFNDLSMLQAVGHPFIMENASPELKKMGFHLYRKVLPVLNSIADCGGNWQPGGETFSI